jgi:hypothetical protein
MSSANRCRCFRGLKSATAFDTNALQSDPDFVGGLTRSLPLARPSGLPVHVARRPSAPFCEDADLLRALFECRGFATQMREHFTSEVK